MVRGEPVLLAPETLDSSQACLAISRAGSSRSMRINACPMETSAVLRTVAERRSSEISRASS